MPVAEQISLEQSPSVVVVVASENAEHISGQATHPVVNHDMCERKCPCFSHQVNRIHHRRKSKAHAGYSSGAPAEMHRDRVLQFDWRAFASRASMREVAVFEPRIK